MIFRLLLRIFLLGLPLVAFTQMPPPEQYVVEGDRIFMSVYRTDAKTQVAKKNWKKRNKLEEITYVVRMPQSWTKEKFENAKKTNIPCVRGVIAICTWNKLPNDLRNNLTYSESYYKHLIKFADENNLAMLTWSNFGGYSPSVSTDEMSTRQVKDYEFIFNDRLSEWETGFKRVMNKFVLPKNAVMLYGFSGGAQIAHRMAMRKPQYFSGIHIHVNSSYDTPNANAKGIVWLVTTGELEYGYSAAKRFYERMIDLGCAVIFKAGENLGHATNAQIDNLSLEFFKYLINFVPDASNPNWVAPPIDKFYLLRHPIYVGDYLNQVAYSVESAVGNVADRKYMVSLPTKPLAKAWGTIIEK